MTIFDVLTLLGGLCLFLFGMSIMGQALERSAGGKLELMLGKLTTNKFAGLLTGLGVTAVIQSSSATTVMVVGFVNSNLMSLRQAIHVIMGANIGTTVTAWVLSLGGISGDSLFIKMLKPTSFTPILAVIGIALYMFAKKAKKKDIGTILLGFAVLMFGMDAMTGAVAGLENVPAFRDMFLLFKNPILGVLVGAILTAIIQSSSASVGILQALAVTGQVSFGAAIPIIMGQNIGTCITAILSSFGTNKNAKRAALVHLSFNIMGTAICLIGYTAADLIFSPALFDEAATSAGIAIAHSAFNIFCTLILFPASSLLEKLAYKLVPESKTPEKVTLLDERFLATPTVALERCHDLAIEMGEIAALSLKNGIKCVESYDAKLAEAVREAEGITDEYEDAIGSYLVKLSMNQIGEQESSEAAKLLKIIGDIERISDHAVNLVESAEELRDKSITFTDAAKEELHGMCRAVEEIVTLSYIALANNDFVTAAKVEPLEQIIDRMKEHLRSQHINRLQAGECSVTAGFVWSDLLTNLERTSDHCSNIAGCVVDAAEHHMNLHESLRQMKSDSPEFKEQYAAYSEKYLKV